MGVCLNTADISILFFEHSGSDDEKRIYICLDIVSAPAESWPGVLLK